LISNIDSFITVLTKFPKRGSISPKSISQKIFNISFALNVDTEPSVTTYYELTSGGLMNPQGDVQTPQGDVKNSLGPFLYSFWEHGHMGKCPERNSRNRPHIFAFLILLHGNFIYGYMAI
jgi:hypothetical protein